MQGKLYAYRCTEQQILHEDVLEHIEGAGDVVEHVIYKGGRDYLLLCRQAPETSPDAPTKGKGKSSKVVVL